MENGPLPIGTGSGYQTAILAQLCEKVYTVEVVKELSEASASSSALGWWGFRTSSTTRLIKDIYNQPKDWAISKPRIASSSAITHLR